MRAAVTRKQRVGFFICRKEPGGKARAEICCHAGSSNWLTTAASSDNQLIGPWFAVHVELTSAIQESHDIQSGKDTSCEHQCPCLCFQMSQFLPSRLTHRDKEDRRSNNSYRNTSVFVVLPLCSKWNAAGVFYTEFPDMTTMCLKPDHDVFTDPSKRKNHLISGWVSDPSLQWNSLALSRALWS